MPARLLKSCFRAPTRRRSSQDPSDSTLSRSVLMATGLVGLAALAYGTGWEREHLELVHLRLRLPGLAPELDGLKLVLVADLHCGPPTSLDYLARVIALVNRQQPDVVALPGDFAANSDRHYPQLTGLLAGLRPRIASVASLGNHDHRHGADGARTAIRKAGVVLLDNDRVLLDHRRRLVPQAARGLCLAGVDDLLRGEPDLSLALAGVDPAIPRVLLSHHPDFAEEPAALAAGMRVDLQLSGHTHGGQVRLPGLGPVVTGSNFGRKYLRGLVAGPGWPVYVTRGIGTSLLPIRIGARPEITVFDLRCSGPTAPDNHGRG